MAIRVMPNGLEIDGRLHPLYSGDMHYWRVERARWTECLDRVKEMGFRFVCTYIPWSVHEETRGLFDFGNRDPKKDIEAFLNLCAEKGLYALVRPGPHINAELTYFGYPERLFTMPEVLSETAEGTQAIVMVPPRCFPAPSYASEVFFEEVGIYFDALCPILRRCLHPHGPVVAVQPDNEMSMFFRTQPYDQDYSFASVRLYHRFLEKKYGDVVSLNRAYGQRYGNFSEVMPPRDFRAQRADELPYYLDWIEYKEYYITNGVNRVSEMLKDRGVTGVATFHNFPTAYPTSPYNIPEMEKHIDVAGIDIYASGREYERVRTGASFAANTSRLPFIPELGSGCWLWWEPLSQKDQQAATLAALMHGVKAFNFYMIVERERWYGSPVGRDGSVRQERFDFYRKLNAFLQESRFHEYEEECEAVLLCCRDYERLQQASTLVSPIPNELLGGLPPEWFCPRTTIQGFSDPVQAVYKQQWRAFRMGFMQAGYPLAVADSDVPLPTLEKYRMVIAPSFEYMSMPLQRKLLVYALKGGVLVMGPRLPLYNEWMRRDSKFALQGARQKERLAELNCSGILLQSVDVFDTNRPLFEAEGKIPAYVVPTEKGAIFHLGFVFPDYTNIDQSPGLAAIMRKIATSARLNQFYPTEDPLIETRLHVRGKERVLFVANPTDGERRPTVRLQGKERLEDVFNGEVLAGVEALEVPVEAASVRMFRVTAG